MLLETHTEIGTASPAAMTRFIERVVDRRDISIEEVERLEGMSERLLAATDEQPPGVTRGDGSTDWLTSAINHPEGRIAEAWLKGLGHRIGLAGDRWQGLPPNVRIRFETLLRGQGNNALLGRVIFASQLAFPFRADRAWTERYVIPQFDWDADADRAAQACDGFLTWGRWSDRLVEIMRPFIRQTVTRTPALRDKRDAFASGPATSPPSPTMDPWHDDG